MTKYVTNPWFFLSQESFKFCNGEMILVPVNLCVTKCLQSKAHSLSATVRRSTDCLHRMPESISSSDANAIDEVAHGEQHVPFK